MAQYPSELKGIIFDIDGTLIDSESTLWYHVFKDLVSYLGLPMWPKGKFRKYAGEFTKELLKNKTPEQRAKIMKQIFSFIKDNYMKHVDKVKPFPKAEKVLQFAKNKGLKIATVTNTFRELSVPTLDRFGMNAYFDAQVYRDDVRHMKPAPDMLLLACAKMGLQKSDIVFVGDTITDKEAAERAGIYFVGVGNVKGNAYAPKIWGVVRVLGLKRKPKNKDRIKKLEGHLMEYADLIGKQNKRR